MLLLPCKYNTTFDGRLLWFDGVEGKRGLTLTVLLLLLLLLGVFVFLFIFYFMGWGGGGQTVSFYSAYWCLWHTMRLTSFRHYYFPQVLSMVM